MASVALRALSSLRTLPPLSRSCVRFVQASRPLSACRSHHDQPFPNYRLDSTVYERYANIDIGNNVLATYIWIDGTGEVWLRSVRVFVRTCESLSVRCRGARGGFVREVLPYVLTYTVCEAVKNQAYVIMTRLFLWKSISIRRWSY